MGLFKGLFNTSKRRKKTKRKSKSTKRSTKKSINSASNHQINKDFIKIKRILNSFEPKKHISPYVIRTMHEKVMEDKLYTLLAYMAQEKLGAQVKKGKGVVDMAYKKIGIELKLNRNGVRRIMSRLLYQAKNYHKKYKKLIIYIVNYQKSSRETSSFVKNFIIKELSDVKSVRKRDLSVIVKKV